MYSKELTRTLSKWLDFLFTVRTNSRTQFIQQRLGIFHISGVDPFGEPMVDVGGRRALHREGPSSPAAREARRGAQDFAAIPRAT
jgi:hypothetical protein